jgi:hypothetical protein
MTGLRIVGFDSQWTWSISVIKALSYRHLEVNYLLLWLNHGVQKRGIRGHCVPPHPMAQ